MSEDGATPRVLHLVFTDVADSAALKQAHGDQAAGRLLERERAELVRLAAECNGRIVDFAGDGCFLTFETASAAVLMALRLQRLHASDADLPRVRVGIHVGEVSEHAQPAGGSAPRVEGLAVDLASRIQGLANPGQVLVSSAVAASARQRLSREVEGRGIRWQSHGRFALKGASEPLEVFEVGLDGIALFSAPQAGDKARRVARRGRPLGLVVGALVAASLLGYFALRARTSPELAPIRSIAVLPLENLSGDPEQAYFADGMTDAMIGELAKVSALKVISRTSVMQHKGAHRPLREIALAVAGQIEIALAPHVALAQVFYSLDWNWAEAEREYLRSLDLTVRSMRAAVEFAVGLYERALADAAWVLEVEPDYMLALRSDALAKQMLGRYEDAAIALDRLEESLPPGVQRFTGYERAWREGGRGGFLAYARQAAISRGSLFALAGTYAASGDTDTAFEVLEKAYAARDTAVALLLTAQLEPLRKDPRFADLARRMNLPVPEDAATH